MIFRQLIAATLILAFSLGVKSQVPLSKSVFHDQGPSKGIVIFAVNWGRYWGCGHYDNAQLQRLAFRRLNSAEDATPGKDWELPAPWSLLTTPGKFESYAYLVDPGEYALSAAKVKVAVSVSDIKVAEVGPSQLIVDGKPVGGSFTVSPGEAVYIGHFGVDCNGEPTLWRFYVNGKKNFEDYVTEFRKRYSFMESVPVVFRLFQTDKLGTPYELPK